MNKLDSDLEVQFLGTGEAFGSQPNTSILINKEFLLDCGFTTLYQLRKASTSLAEVKWIFLSHLHGDHTFALPAFLVASWEEERKGPLTIVSTRQGREYIKNLLDLAYRKSLQELGFTVKFKTVNESLTFSEYHASFAPLKHSVPTFAVSLNWKAFKITYLSDGFPTKKAEMLAEGSNLLIAEAYQKGVETHSSPLKAAKIAKKRNVKKLALVHAYRGEQPSLNEAKKIYPELILPQPLQILTFS